MPTGPGTYGPKRRRQQPGQGAVSNSGTRSTSTQTTGATGAATNTVRTTATAGKPGASGTRSTPNPEADAARALAQTHVDEARKMAGDAAEGALHRAEAALALHRQRVLGMVPAEHRDRVNEAFDRGHAAIESVRKRRQG